jgi:alpha-L-fucosidase 2
MKAQSTTNTDCLSLTPSFSQVREDARFQKTVLTVSSEESQTPKWFRPLQQFSDSQSGEVETAEAVPPVRQRRFTRLKPGVNEKRRGGPASGSAGVLAGFGHANVLMAAIPPWVTPCGHRSRTFALLLLSICSLAVNLCPAALPSGTNFITGFSGKLLGQASPPEGKLTLWYTRPAEKWVEALAIGNGRLGAMVFGGIERERLQLNEDTLWAGQPYDPSNPDALEALPEARRLIFNGDYSAAVKLVDSKMMARPVREMPYQLVGDLLLHFAETESVEDYRGELDLDTAVTRVTYKVKGCTFTREVFASPVDQVIVLRIRADQPGQVAFHATMDTPQRASLSVEAPGTLMLSGTNGDYRGITGSLRFNCRVRVLAVTGQVSIEDQGITVKGANSATLLIAAATAYKNYADISGNPEAITRRQIRAAERKSFEKMLAAHTAEHQRLFRRVHLDLGSTDASRLPTDERIHRSAEADDPALATLYFQFGRYLLISSSRPGCQPANLQGIWNDSMTPPWESKYTININTEMNYWPAETCNLSECAEPLFGLIRDISKTGTRTAKVNYGARGWVAHHNTDLWRATAPVDAAEYGFWPTGGAWLCYHLWEHYLFTGDKKFLARAYPIMKGAAQFFLDTLVEDPKSKWLVTCPSLSPENKHPHGYRLCAGPAMDMQILRDLFANCIRAAEILRTDKDLRVQLDSTRQRLAPHQIGKAGQLREWLEDWDMEAGDLSHRHVSHLYALFPSAQITLRGTPELATAAKRSLEIRGDRATGWGIGWRLNLWARLQDGDHAHSVLSMLLSSQRTYPNMFDAHPPFQIDGNFGGAAGIAEMLLQSHTGELELLPALPSAWKSGSVSGLRARGGYEVAIRWAQGRLISAGIKSVWGGSCKVRYGSTTATLPLRPGKTVTWKGT